MRTGNYFTTHNDPLHATVSIGVSYISHLREGDSVEDLLRDADKALYQAKAGGRDCVKLASIH